MSSRLKSDGPVPNSVLPLLLLLAMISDTPEFESEIRTSPDATLDSTTSESELLADNLSPDGEEADELLDEVAVLSAVV